ncbi:MAG: hypothetical protein HY825_04925 [Acidobacteria bacterium]|nr:hypothetical protein [Acidobacteriota bacterium]
MTYNFDADAWYERERAALKRRGAAGELNDAELTAAVEDLDRRYDEMLARLDGSFAIPPTRQ